MVKTAVRAKETLRPAGNRLVVRPDAAEDVTPGGIVLPDAAKDKPQRGTVVAVGPRVGFVDGKPGTPMFVEGDTVIYSKYGGTVLGIGDEQVLVIEEEHILGKIVG